MCTERIRARAASATPLATGYVTHRKLAFHKRGRDGSAKADAVYTGRIADRVWGVVFSLRREEKLVLDGYEWDYEQQKVVFLGQYRIHSAIIYTARLQAIDVSLKPYSWYHRLVLRGATEHRLPNDYLKQLRSFQSFSDSDLPE